MDLAGFFLMLVVMFSVLPAGLPWLFHRSRAEIWLSFFVGVGASTVGALGYLVYAFFHALDEGPAFLGLFMLVAAPVALAVGPVSTSIRQTVARRDELRMDT